MAKYATYHSHDQLGGRYERPVLDGEFDTLDEAVAHAEEYGGAVRRTADGAIMGPGGRWIAEDGRELP